MTHHGQPDGEWAEAEPELRAGAVIDQIELASRERQRGRSPVITPRDALMALRFEATFLHVIGSALRSGEAVSAQDHARLVVAVNRIAVIVDEAIR